MINIQRCSRDFIGLAAYLVGQERETGPECVEWTATRNLPTQDPATAATFMRATASQSVRTETPVYHIVLSSAPEDSIDRATMERIADRVLDRLGLAHHQAVLVAHGDRPHHHLHIMVNRVHPETGRAWGTWQDYIPVREVLNEEERALGLRHTTPMIQSAPDLRRDLGIYERLVALSREQREAETEANTARARATSLELTVERARATRDRRDQDLAQVYRDPHKAHGAYLAAADRDGLPAATERMRERPEELGALRTAERSRALGLGHTADEGPARAAARAAATAAQEAVEAARAWQVAAVTEAERAGQAFARDLEATYQDPAAARTAFERLAAERGIDEAAATVRTGPAYVGVVRPSLNLEASQSQPHLAQVAALGVEAAQARLRAMAALATPGELPFDAGPELTRGAVDRAMARDGALRAEVRALPSRTELERRLSVALDRLTPRALAVLKYRVTRPQFAIALRLRRTFRDLALGREEERDE